MIMVGQEGVKTYRVEHPRHHPLPLPPKCSGRRVLVSLNFLKCTYLQRCLASGGLRGGRDELHYYLHELDQLTKSVGVALASFMMLAYECSI
jgi:hypothetical protein